MTATILVIYHSQTGRTKTMAERVAAGISSIEGARALLKPAAEATLQDLLQCRGLVIGSPEYFGYMAGQVKDFFDRTYEQARDKPEILRKPLAVFISAGNDGSGALRAIERICLGYRFRKVAEPLIARGEIESGVLEQCETLGKTIAAGCEAGIY